MANIVRNLTILILCRGANMSKLGKKILAMFGVVSLITIIILFGTYEYMFNRVEGRLKTNANGAINRAVKSIDTNKLQQIIDGKSKDNPLVKEMVDSMKLFKADEDIKNYYIYVKVDDKTAEFVADASPEPADYLEKYDMNRDMLKAFNGTVAITNKPYSDKWGTYVSAYAPIKDSSGKIMAVVGADEDISTFQNMRQEYFTMLIISALICVFFPLIIVYLFSNRLQKNIKAIQGNLDRMAEGDLTSGTQVNSNDEIELINKSINTFRLKIGDIINSIKENSRQVLDRSNDLSRISSEMSSSSESVSSVIQDVAQNSTKQSAEFINISSSMEEFGEKIEDISRSILDVTEGVELIDNESVESNNNIKLLAKSINDVDNEFKLVVNSSDALSEDIDKINEIINFIDEISDQTNLLALNASIEAARAGEAGKGFAVVAEEIRKLAEQSKRSSESINELLKKIGSETNGVVNTTQNVKEELINQLGVIEKSTSSFNRVYGLIKEILPKIERVDQSINSIKDEKDIILSDIEDSSAMSQEISASSEEIASLSEELSSAADEVAGSSEKLSSMMEDMNSSIEIFKTENK